MGQTYEAECKECGYKFEISEGGGFTFHQLRCDTCGASKNISFKIIGEPHLRYVKGLQGPYCLATSESDRRIQENYPGEPLSESDYHAAVEKMAGKCGCGGLYRFRASPRCPKCRSKQLVKGEITECYD